MRASLLIVGNEIIAGRTQDANSVMIAKEIKARRWEVGSILAVGDDYAQIAHALKFLMGKGAGNGGIGAGDKANDVIIIVGGLGPTVDDITTEALARALGRETFVDAEALAHIKGLFTRFALKWSENNTKQAVFPIGAKPIPNNIGVAWGYSLSHEGRLLFVLPGPPQEAEAVLKSGVIPILEETYGEGRPAQVLLQVRVFGISEARLAELIEANGVLEADMEIGFYPRFPEVLLVITASAGEEAQAQEKIARVRERISTLLGNYAFSFVGESLEEVVAKMLTERGGSVATAESCSGGLLADRLTNVPGSSAYFLGGIVCYSNHIKTGLLGVPKAILGEHGAVSAQTARALADGVRRLMQSDFGVSITGIAGPAGGSPTKPVGTVFIAISDRGGVTCRHFSFRWERRRNKIISTQTALFMLWQRLREMPK